MLSAQSKKELLRSAEYQGRTLVCEPDNGPLLDEDKDDTEKELVENEGQYEEVIPEASKETMESHDFEIDNWCVNVGYASLDDGELHHECNNTKSPINGIMEGSIVPEGRNLDFEEDQEPNGCSMDDEALKRYCNPKDNYWCMHANYEVDESGQFFIAVMMIGEGDNVKYDE